MTIHEVEPKIHSLFHKTVTKDKDLHNALLLIHSDKLGIHWKYAGGTVGKEQKPNTEDHTFHIASIGKLFTSVLIGKLYEKGQIDYNDPISKYLSNEILKDLHRYKGKTYADKILVRHLLNHTSGIPDYFTEEPKMGKGKKMLDLAVEDPSRFWTPQETVQWAKDNLQPHFPPGQGFYYSDTGYQLLGLIIEKITGKPMHESLHREIFDPLDMKHSYQLFYSESKEKSQYPVADIYLDKVEVSTFRSLSIDWAGGGIVSNTEDLLLFIKALKNNTLLKQETFNTMKDWAKFSRGIDYGYGLISIKFNEMLFIFPRRLDIWGNFGSTGTYMFYNPALDTYVIGAFNQMNYMKKQVRFIIKVLNKISKVRR